MSGRSVNETLAVVIAGGRARRMGGGDKCLLPLRGRPLLAHVLDALASQVGRIVLNANGDPSRFAAFGLEVLPDPVPGRPGPLAGVLAGLEAAGPGTCAVLAVAGDMPFLPRDLCARLAAALAPGIEIAVAEAGGRLQPLAGLWRPTLAPALRADLAAGRASAVHRWLAGRRSAAVAFAPDGFADIDSPDDLEAAERRLAAAGPPASG